MTRPQTTSLIAIAAMACTTASQAAVSVTNTYLTLDGVSKAGYTNPLAVDTGGTNPTTVIDGTLGTARFGYSAKVAFTNNDYAAFNTTITPGGWSWANLQGAAHTPPGPGGTLTGINQGWGHTSRWYLIEVTEADFLQISMTPWNNPGTPGDDTIDARPGFTIFSGESLNHTFGNAHTYNNDGANMSLNDGWDKNGPSNTRGLTYFDNGSNTTGSSLSESVYMEAGLYTIVFGNIGDSGLNTSAKGFNVTMAIPEPSAALLGVIGGLTVCLRRRRSA